MLNIYTDSDCQNLLKQIRITPQDATQENTYATDEKLEPGVYYIKMEEGVNGYNAITDTIIREVKAQEKYTTWEMVLRPGMLLPPYGNNTRIEVSNPIQTEDYKNCTINFTIESVGEVPEELNLDDEIEIYEIANYDEVKDEYTYINGFDQLNLPKLTTKDVYEIICNAYQNEDNQVNNTMKMLEEHLLSNSMPQIGKIGNGNGVYLIRPKEVGTEKEQYSFMPFICVPGLYTNEQGEKCQDFKLYISWKKELQYGNLKLITTLERYNESLGEVIIVYGINAVDEEETVYSEVISVNMQEAGTNTTVIENIPAATNATVEVLYCSAGSELLSDAIRSEIINRNDTAYLDFSYDVLMEEEENQNKYGKAYINARNTYNLETAKWQWQINKDYGNNLKINLDKNEDNITVSIKNTGEKVCFVRLRLLTKVEAEARADEPWRTDLDNYYYYDTILQSNETTKEIVFNITQEDKKDYNTIVVVEGANVFYNEDGISYAEW